jgi:nucleotidyltransferase/DNA polymerase involved in DNA repair
MSRKPLVVMNAVGKPFLSRTALVATVEPCARSSIEETGMPLDKSALKAPSSGALGTLGTFVTTIPAGPIATRSVKVPPTSIPTRMRRSPVLIAALR